MMITECQCTKKHSRFNSICIQITLHRSSVSPSHVSIRFWMRNPESVFIMTPTKGPCEISIDMKWRRHVCSREHRVRAKLQWATDVSVSGPSVGRGGPPREGVTLPGHKNLQNVHSVIFYDI